MPAGVTPSGLTVDPEHTQECQGPCGNTLYSPGHTFTVKEVENTALVLLSMLPLFVTVYHLRGQDTIGRGLGYKCHDSVTALQK